MDPDTALAILREAVARYADGKGSDAERSTALQTVLETFEGLDGWLMKGGFLPASWQPRT